MRRASRAATIAAVGLTSWALADVVQTHWHLSTASTAAGTACWVAVLAALAAHGVNEALLERGR